MPMNKSSISIFLFRQTFKRLFFLRLLVFGYHQKSVLWHIQALLEAGVKAQGHLLYIASSAERVKSQTQEPNSDCMVESEFNPSTFRLTAQSSTH